MVKALSEAEFTEGLTRFTHAIVEDAALRSWFIALEQLPTSMRKRALAEMAEQMRTGKEDSDLIAAVASVARPEMFDAVMKAVRERCGL